MREFLGFGGYTRPAEGFLSWQHLTFVSSLMVLMVAFALYFSHKNKNRTSQAQNRVLIGTALLMDGLEIFKILMLCLRTDSIHPLLANLPLFLCSIHLLTIPLAAFSKGKIREAAMDFICIFGMLSAVMGTYGAGQNYNAYPVLSMDNVISGLTHSISGFAALYIFCVGMASMKKENIGFTFGILLTFCTLAAVANHFLDTNYMFLRRGDGTPYDLIYNLVNGNPLIYGLSVVVLFMIYIVVFYAVYYLLPAKRKQTIPA